MSYTKEDPEPKVLEFHKNKIVWSVILFSLSGILLHFFPLKLDFLSCFAPSSRRQVAASLPSETAKPKAPEVLWAGELDPEK